VTLIAHDGTVTADSGVAPENLTHLENHLDRPEISQARISGTGVAIRYSETLKSRMIYVAVPFSSGGETGYIRTALPLAALDRLKSELHTLLGATALAAVALSFILSWILAAITVRPLREMADAARHIGEGNYDRRLDESGSDEVSRLAAVMNQMTDRIAAQINDLKRLEQVRSDFIANVSHELRTPVSIIKGYAETLLDGTLESNPEKARSFVTKIENHANRMAVLIRDLLTLSELESTGFRFEVHAIPLAVVTQQITELLRLKADSREILVRNELSKNIPLVLANRQRIEQVLFNLLDNAISYTPHGGTVTIHGEHDNNVVKIRVTDNGLGIPPHHLPRIFERFYRVDPARSREAGGTGLGLAIVKHIVQLHGGSVGSISEPGLGSTFWFTLPIADQL
jgi:signal transduction histidine kinase